MNEQWPSWWQKLFDDHGYRFYDYLRPVIWNNNDVEWWYRQNIFIVSNHQLTYPEDYLKNFNTLDLVHPVKFQRTNEELEFLKTNFHSVVPFKKLLNYKLRLKLRNLLRFK